MTIPLPEPDAWRSQSPVGGYHFSETRPTGAVEKYPQTPLVTMDAARAYGAACAAEADKRWEDALSQTWRMVDPFNPAGTPGSYARGQDSGIVAALTTLRANLKAAAIRASAMPEKG